MKKLLTVLLFFVLSTPSFAWNAYGAIGDVASVAAIDLSNVSPNVYATGTLPIANGGTGATTSSAALAALGGTTAYDWGTFGTLTLVSGASVTTGISLGTFGAATIKVLALRNANLANPPAEFMAYCNGLGSGVVTIKAAEGEAVSITTGGYIVYENNTAFTVYPVITIKKWW